MTALYAWSNLVEGGEELIGPKLCRLVKYLKYYDFCRVATRRSGSIDRRVFRQTQPERPHTRRAGSNPDTGRDATVMHASTVNAGPGPIRLVVVKNLLLQVGNHSTS